MIHLIIKEERRESAEQKYAARKAEAEKNPANVSWIATTEPKLVTTIDGNGESEQVMQGKVERFTTEAEALAYKAGDASITLEKHVIVPPDPFPSRVPVTSINADIRTYNGTDSKGVDSFIVTPMPAQLHTMAEEVNDFSNIAYAASWDGRSPWIEVLAGDIADLKLAYFGWPMVTKEQWEKDNPIGDDLG